MKRFFIFLLLLYFFIVYTTDAFATEDPLKTPNNIVGVHILFPTELDKAAELINSNGGDWGYVTIPIQSGDKNILKWQEFMTHAKQLHIIPIMRLATQGDYFNTSVWSKPTFANILDFANFLDSLDWPTKNRYILVYNEPNRADEWGGGANPQEYANILSYAVTAFKTKNPDFFIISAGLDNAAATTGTTFDQYTFLTKMNQAIPGIFNQLDGYGSHSYPNPAFSQPPLVNTSESIASFQYEMNLVSSFTTKQLPIFITETGWSRDHLSDATIASYLPIAFTSVWNDKRVVTVTPFLLLAGGGPFESFSLLKGDGGDTPESLAIKAIPKSKGAPTVNPSVLSAETILNLNSFPIKNFNQITGGKTPNPQFLSNIKALAKYLLHL